jgi:hypothetical protein
MLACAVATLATVRAQTFGKEPVMQSIYPPMSQGGNAMDNRHARIVAQRLPSWLTQATPAMRQALRTSQDESHAAKVALKPILDRLRDVTAFCADRLKQEIHERFQLDIDPRRHSLVRALHNDGMGFRHRFAIEQNLLVAAMQNFEVNLRFPTGSMVLPVGSLEYVSQDKDIDFRARPDKPAIAIDPKRFADACRALDLGRRYQEHLDTVFKPAEQAEAVSALFARNDRAGFAVQAHIARLRGDVAEDSYRMLLQIVEGVPAGWAGKALRYHWLRLLGSPDFPAVSLYGVHLIESVADGRCVVFMPGEPDHPFKEYTSFQAFATHLGLKLQKSAYQTYFRSLVGEKFDAGFNQRLQLRLKDQATDWVKHLNLEKMPSLRSASVAVIWGQA